MSKYKYYPDYDALYPGVEIMPKVMEALRESDRKMKYIEYDLKCEGFVLNVENGFATFLSSREDSLDRLQEADKQFRDEAALPEDVVVDSLYIEELHRCIARLDTDERVLIKALFFNGLTEREYAQCLGLCQKTINNQKHNILYKLANFLNP